MRTDRAATCVALCSGLLLCACSSGGQKPSTPGTGGGGTIAPGGSGGAGANPGTGGTANTTGGSGGKRGSGGSGGSHPGGSGGSGSGGSGSNGGTSGSGAAPGDASVLQYHRNASRDGVYVDTAFTRDAAKGLHRDASFSAQLSGPTYAQPLYFDAGSGGKDLVIVATEQNQVSAFNAADGSVAWQQMLGAPAARFDLPCGNIDPLGITGTPVIDPSSKTLYLDAMTLDGGTPKHMIHALSLADGSEVSGWPVDVNASAKAGSLAFDSSVQNQRGGLTLLNGMLYVPYGGHFGDCGNYHGWVVGVPLDKPSAPIGWATRAKAGGIWAPGGIASDGSSLFVATGNTMSDNGFFTPPSQYGDGESVIRLPPNLQYAMQDSDFAAAMDWANLDSGDADIGGSGPVLFNVPGASPADVGIALGKDGNAYLLDTKNLGGMGHWVATQHVSSNQIIQAAVAYTTKQGTFVAFRGTGMGCPSGAGEITALRIAAAAPPTISIEWCAGPNGTGSPMVTTTDGSAESIVWYVAAESDNHLYGFNAETGAQVFDGGGSAEALSSVNRFQTPIAAKGRIFVAGSNELYAFTLK